MRIGIDAYLLHAGADYRAAGVSIYTLNLLRSLPAAAPRHEYVAFVGPAAPGLPGTRTVAAPVPIQHPPLRIVWEQTGLPAQAALARIDVFHGAVNVLPEVLPWPSVVTVHDLSFMRHPERLSRTRAIYLELAVKRSAQHATRLIAVSANTRCDLVELLGIDPSRISVVHLGVDPSFRLLPAADAAAFRERISAGRPYILHVGTLEPRKNIDVLIRAYASIRARLGIPHALVLAGARGWSYESLFALVSERGLEDDVRFVDYVAPAALPLWYNSADLFAYPSAYEGFGLPVLEAMACGTPTITSASSSLQELAAGAGMTVEPGSDEALEGAIVRVLEDGRLRERMRQAGLQRASEFSWDRTARETIAVYESAAGRA